MTSFGIPARALSFAVSVLFALPAAAQVFTFTREQLIEFTAKNPFERFEDGRPKVPDAMLQRAKGLTAEDVLSVLNGAKYTNQYEGNWRILHPERKLVGRAVTAQFMPLRPDVAEALDARAKAKGQRANHQAVIDTLGPNDVLVADLFGKIENGTIVGNNLATYIAGVTKAGLVVDGAIRDLESIFPLDISIYCRGMHPSAIGNVMLTGVNVPVRVGSAVVMPGDVVLGDREGVYFIPPHYVKDVVEKAEATHILDEWRREKLLSGKYKSSDLYPSPKDPVLKQESEEYKRKKLGK